MLCHQDSICGIIHFQTSGIKWCPLLSITVWGHINSQGHLLLHKHLIWDLASLACKVIYRLLQLSSKDSQYTGFTHTHTHTHTSCLMGIKQVPLTSLMAQPTTDIHSLASRFSSVFLGCSEPRGTLYGTLILDLAILFPFYIKEWTSIIQHLQSRYMYSLGLDAGFG